MEHVGAIWEGEWNSFTGMCSDESDFMAQLLGNSFLPDEVPNVPHHAISTFWPSHDPNVNIEGVDESSMFSSEETNSSMTCFPQRSNYGGGPSSSHESYYPTAAHQLFVTNNNLMAMDYGVLENKNYCSEMHVFMSSAMEGNDYLNHNVRDNNIESNENMPEDAPQRDLRPGREPEMPMPRMPKEDKSSCPPEISKKRPRTRGGIPRSKRNTKLQKCMETDDSDEENNNVVLHRPSSSNCCSDDESNSHEQSGMTSSSRGVPKLNGKARASRGSSADPQSLYARKRRERINERLRILQNLVPNGTKVDISTMLEEAVQYVKFLQLQIKLLSSDDTWMYAPIAFNGMDLGLDLRISLSKSQT